MPPKHPKSVVPLSLPASYWEYLRAAAAEHSLPDAGKAFRCCINYAGQAGGDKVWETTHEQEAAPGAPEAGELELAQCQMDVLQAAAAARFGSDTSAAARHLIQACRAADPAEVYGVIRCKSANLGPADAQTPCPGAVSALAARAAAE
eukprot:TRINITY_DN23458_c0_g1_i1.p2 TRINITY_DN23458_c0_g1~~TRINITY_DN23458_c0_g1_i1.p2  ORF type:complete len:172 (+),score=56.53 TRINITY_DN23458_c0_g1_i1:75-518(+)